MSNTNRPVVIDTDIRPIDRRLRNATGILLCLDFDGTLAPIVSDPADAIIDPACAHPLSRLRDLSKVHVAIVSGRDVHDVRKRVNLARITYAGNHGLEIMTDRGQWIHPTASTYRPVLDDLAARLRGRLSEMTGSHVEDKGLSLTVHYRRSPHHLHESIVETVHDATTDRAPDLELRPAKRSIEIRPPIAWDKGSTVRWIQSRVPASWVTVYVGDDTTDEDAFAILRPSDIGIAIGGRTDTAATFRFSDRDHVAAFLRWLVDRRDSLSPGYRDSMSTDPSLFTSTTRSS